MMAPPKFPNIQASLEGNTHVPRTTEEAVPGPSVFPLREPGLSGNFGGRHGDLTSLAPHERLPEILVDFFRVAAGFSSYDVDFRLPLVLALGSPNFPSSCWTPLRPLRGLQETRVATREESGVLGFPSRRGLT